MNPFRDHYSTFIAGLFPPFLLILPIQLEKNWDDEKIYANMQNWLCTKPGQSSYNESDVFIWFHAAALMAAFKCMFN